MRKWILPGLFGVFLCVSTITLSSIMPTLAGRQLLFFLIAGAVFIAVSRIPFRHMLEYRVLAYTLACVGLIIPFLFSMTTRGTVRWIQLTDGIALQPSQLTLPMISLLLIWQMTKDADQSWKKILVFLSLLLLPTAIIAMQPDLDTAIVLVVSLGSIMLFTQTSWQKLLMLLGGALVLTVIAWSFVLQPYQKSRVTSLIAGNSGEGHSYNAQQSLIAVGSGGMFGVGIGQGTQSHLRFLPERHTDFIFASLAEEYGFVGTSLVIALYTILVAFLVWSVHSIQQPAGQLFLLAAAVMFGTQALINIGMNVGLLPIAGITLPLLSYGGSAVIGQALILGVAHSIIVHDRRTALIHIE